MVDSAGGVGDRSWPLAGRGGLTSASRRCGSHTRLGTRIRRVTNRSGYPNGYPTGAAGRIPGHMPEPVVSTTDPAIRPGCDLVAAPGHRGARPDDPDRFDEGATARRLSAATPPVERPTSAALDPKPLHSDRTWPFGDWEGGGAAGGGVGTAQKRGRIPGLGTRIRRVSNRSGDPTGYATWWPRCASVRRIRHQGGQVVPGPRPAPPQPGHVRELGPAPPRVGPLGRTNRSAERPASVVIRRF